MLSDDEADRERPVRQRASGDAERDERDGERQERSFLAGWGDDMGRR
jgi:hypothetical protein